jgi:hypothetical protein
MDKTNDVTNDSKKQDLIQEKSINISNKYDCQTGILTPFEINEHALYIIRMFYFFFFLLKIKKKFLN